MGDRLIAASKVLGEDGGRSAERSSERVGER